MNAYVSTELSMIQMLDPQRHELALLQEAFLNKGGTIEVLQGPSFVPPPVRHEPPPSRKAKPVSREPEKPNWLDKMAMRDIEREERAAQRAKERVELIEQIRTLAQTMTYAQAINSAKAWRVPAMQCSLISSSPRALRLVAVLAERSFCSAAMIRSYCFGSFAKKAG